MKQELTLVKPIGTDGEKNLVDAAICYFPQTAHIRCFRHLQQNIEQHLCEEQFPPPTVIKLFVGNIFEFTNSDGTYHEELVDSGDAQTVDVQLDDLKEGDRARLLKTSMLTLLNVHLTITKIQYCALNRMFLFCSLFCIPHYTISHYHTCMSPWLCTHH